MNNLERTKGAADALDELSNLIELKGSKGVCLDKFKIKQYRNAATTLRNYDGDISSMTKSQLMGIKGIGKSISDKILEFLTTGEISKVAQLKATLPPVSVVEFTKLRRIGPAGAKKLWKETGASTMEELIKLADAGKLDSNLVKSIEFFKTTAERILLSEALTIVEPIVTSLKGFTAIKKIEHVGSLLRKKDLVHDADLLALVEDKDEAKKIFDKFVTFADEVEVRGDSKTAIYTNGFKVELIIINDPLEWGASFFHFAGPADYNKKNRMLAIKKGLMLNDKGLWDKNKNRLDDGTEESICKQLEIEWLEPELREVAVIVDDIPEVVTKAKRDYHIHTTMSDGCDSVKEIVQMAISYGLERITITDHGKSLAIAGGIKDLDKYFQEIIDAQTSAIDLKIGIEANMTKTGELDYTDDELKRFDVVVASAHSAFEQTSALQTARYLKVIETLGRRGGINIIGHPVLDDYGKRDASEFDWDKIFEACVKHNVALELSGLPTRIGFTIQQIQRAKRVGVKFSLGSDSHRYNSNALTLSLWRARRGGLTEDDLI